MGWHKEDKERIDRHKWVGVRALVLDRDGWACVKCGRKGRLEVDHIVSLAHGGDLYGMENLQTLDRECHFAKTELERKEDTESDETKEWREFMADSV